MKEYNLDQIIIDGAPGIGCPVIASLSGVSFALIVTEPSLSGLHDAERVMDEAQHFEVPVKIIINKYDLNADMNDKMRGVLHKPQNKDYRENRIR